MRSYQRKMKKFEILDHTADVRARVFGNNPENLFENAAGLLYRLMETGRGRQGTEESIMVEAGTLEDLLVRFLNELIYLAETAGKAGRVKVERISREGGRMSLSARMGSRQAVSLGKEVKAATYHGLKIKEEKGILSVSIIFDV